MTDQTPTFATIRQPALSACLAGSRRGWTPARRTQFLDHLAGDGSVSAASGRVGMSREAAYRLRRRDALFARAWDAALVLARAVSAEVLASRAIDGIEEEIWYRGELVGTRRKYDDRLLLAHMARLDRIVEEGRATEDAARFDELLALVGGETVPGALMADEDALPLPRETALELARVAAVGAWEETPKRQRTDTSCYDAADGAEAETAVTWDAWRSHACNAVDRLLEAPASGALSTVSTSPTEGAAAATQDSVALVAPVSPSPVRGPHPFGYTYARA